jgi:4-oxalomesaconate tautomerase
MMLRIPCVLMRGGSSKGLYFRADDLPRDPPMRDRMLLAAMGSPDRRQIDGLGGGDEQSSKVVIVGASSEPGVDIECLHAQVSVNRDVVDAAPNSGNMLCGVAPYAITHGFTRAVDPETIVRIRDLNTGRIVEALVQTPQGKVAYEGTHPLDDLGATGSPILLRFIEPAGGCTGKLLPTGHAVDDIDGVPATCIDFGNPVVIVKASDVGRSGYETKQALDADADLLARLETLRQGAAARMGLDHSANGGLPKVVLIAPPAAGGTIASRYFSPTRCHTGYALTGALSLIAACNVPASVAATLVNPLGADLLRIVIEHPTGQLEAGCVVGSRSQEGIPAIPAATVVTTARPLFTGTAFVRESSPSP